MGRSLSSRGAATLTRGKFHAQSLRLQGDFLTKNHSYARRIRAWRGLRRPKQKLRLNNQFISHIIENVGSERVSRIGVQSIPTRARGDARGFFSVLTSPSPSPCVPKELLPDQDTAIYEQTLHISTPDCCLLDSSIPYLPQRVNTQLLEQCVYSLHPRIPVGVIILRNPTP